jgi:hypothetical protein
MFESRGCVLLDVVMLADGRRKIMAASAVSL